MEDLTAMLLPFMIVGAWLFLLALTGVMLSQDAARESVSARQEMTAAVPFKDVTAERVMHQDICYFSPEATGLEMAETMTDGGSGSVPIVDGQYRLIGIVSESDLLKAMGDGRPLEAITAGEIMTRTPIAVTEKTSLNEVVQILQSRHLIRVPVTDKEGLLTGILARRDILKEYVEFYEAQRAAA